MAPGILLDDAWVSLFPDGGIRRGVVVGCTGPAALTLAIALVARQAASGSWVAVIGVPELGAEAAAELGVPLERLVAVDRGGSATEWAERVVAAADGFDLIVTSPPGGAHRLGRRVAQRIRSRGAVLFSIGERLDTELDVGACEVTWLGADDGHGRLVARRAMVTVTGRRVPRERRAEMWLPAADGRIRPVGTEVGGVDVAGGDAGAVIRAG